jgi:nucleoside 2-deoxyribosyltransferase
MIENGTSIEVATAGVFRADIEAIRRASIIVAVLDGRTIDEGVAFELGFAHALSKRCIGLQSDVRRLLPFGNNPMIDGALEATLPSVDALLSHLRSGG